MAGEQSQEKPPKAGRLYIVGLPIGNLDDVTVRAIRLLRRMDIIASKDPRHTQTLLLHHGIRALVTTYDRRNAQEKARILLQRLRAGSRVALVSDCGTPGLYDAGALLVAHAHRAGIPVVSVPGPSALTAALSIAGMPGDVLCFHGRFPTSPTAGMRLLAAVKARRSTSIFFVSAEQLRHVLTLVERYLGNRTVLVAANLTKRTERIVRGKVRTLLTRHTLYYPAADVTVVVDRQ